MTTEVSTKDEPKTKRADADAWTRSKNKRYLRKVARQYLRKMGGHPRFDKKQLEAMAYREKGS